MTEKSDKAIATLHTHCESRARAFVTAKLEELRSIAIQQLAELAPAAGVVSTKVEDLLNAAWQPGGHAHPAMNKLVEALAEHYLSEITDRMLESVKTEKKTLKLPA